MRVICFMHSILKLSGETPYGKFSAGENIRVHPVITSIMNHEKVTGTRNTSAACQALSSLARQLRSTVGHFKT